MTRLGHRLQRAEVVQARQAFTHGHHFGAPSVLDQGVLAQELRAFVATDHRHQLASATDHAGRGPMRGAGLLHLCVGELQAALQERGLLDRGQIKQARDRHRLAHQVRRQIGTENRPIAGQHHRGQMSASGVAHHADARGVTTKSRDMACHPNQGARGLQRDVGHRDCWAQGVIDHHHTSALRHERWCHEAVIGFVQTAPIAAMDKHQHRCSLDGLVGHKQVQAFVRTAAVGHVQIPAKLLARDQ